MSRMKWAIAYYREIARGQIRGDTTGRLKLIFHRGNAKICWASTSLERGQRRFYTLAKLL